MCACCNTALYYYCVSRRKTCRYICTRVIRTGDKVAAVNRAKYVIHYYYYHHRCCVTRLFLHGSPCVAVTVILFLRYISYITYLYYLYLKYVNRPHNSNCYCHTCVSQPGKQRRRTYTTLAIIVVFVVVVVVVVRFAHDSNRRKSAVPRGPVHSATPIITTRAPSDSVG